MKRSFIYALGIIAAVFTSTGCGNPSSAGETPLKDVFEGKFYVGAAMNARQIKGIDVEGVKLLEREFNSIVAEDCMKSEKIHPEKDVYDFTLPDEFVAFGERNNMRIIGHTLVWHSQLAKWFCVDDEGKEVSREVLIERMRDHIMTVVGRYKGRVHGWDVVNEAVNDDGTLRETPFLRIIGEDYLRLAFEFAHEADPDAELYYNDFSMSIPAKRDGVVALVNKLKEQGARVDGVGMQGHMGMDGPSLEEYEAAIKAYASTGVKVMITELDMSVLPFPNRNMGANIGDTAEYQKHLNPYTDGLPEDVAKAWNDRMFEFFKLFHKYSGTVTRVTLWGVADGDSWKNNWPVRGRTDYPLLFDRDHKAKPVVERMRNELK